MQAAGTLLQGMTHDLIGMKVTGTPQVSANNAVHAFPGNRKSDVFISSARDTPMTLNLDLGTHLECQELVPARLLQADPSKAGRACKTRQGVKPRKKGNARSPLPNPARFKATKLLSAPPSIDQLIQSHNPFNP